MKLAPRLSAAAALLVSFQIASLPTASAAPTPTPRADQNTTTQEQQPAGALQRGYRTGYSDGYQAGWSDSAARRQRDYRSREDYQRGDRAHLPAYGALEDYRDGYQQGFESGYAAGYDRRGFDSAVPDKIARRGASTTNTTDADERDETASSVSTSGRRTSDDASRTDVSDSRSTSPARGSGSGIIPAGTMLRVELSNRLSSDVSQRGDPFEARVVEPREYAGAIVSGRVSRVQRAGKVKGTAQLQLSFDQIRFADGRTSDFNAQVTEVIYTDEESGVGGVDPEGGVRGRDSTKDDVAKVGAAAGIGAIIGAIAGGGKGAGIGAVIGGAAGTGGVMTQRGKDIRLERGQQLMIRASR
ncbi:MAG TPA: hypothetical protein VGB73_12515 [Pyrinomonadaceae bacterium]|jgi:hypothetical protein